MKGIASRRHAAEEPIVPAGERALLARVAAEAVSEFRGGPWLIVSNAGGRRIFGLAPGVYPDLVALDGSESSVAWALELATPSMLAEESAWERWARTAGTGCPTILAVPSGAGGDASRVAGILGIDIGLVYEYSVGLEGVEFSVPRLPREPRRERVS